MCTVARRPGNTCFTERQDAGNNDGTHRNSIPGPAVPVQTAQSGMTTLGHLHPASKLVRYMLHAVDGEIGALEALYFDCKEPAGSMGVLSWRMMAQFFVFIEVHPGILSPGLRG